MAARTYTAHISQTAAKGDVTVELATTLLLEEEEAGGMNGTESQRIDKHGRPSAIVLAKPTVRRRMSGREHFTGTSCAFGIQCFDNCFAIGFLVNNGFVCIEVKQALST